MSNFPVQVYYRESDRQGWETILCTINPNTPDIIAASPFFKEEGMNCRRIVLRRSPTSDLIVHTQQIPTPGNDCQIAFSHGDYYNVLHQENAWEKAWTRFEERSRKLFNLSKSEESK